MMTRKQKAHKARRKLISMQKDLQSCWVKSEELKDLLEIPSLGELLLIKVQVEQIIEMAKEKS